MRGRVFLLAAGTAGATALAAMLWLAAAPLAAAAPTLAEQRQALIRARAQAEQADRRSQMLEARARSSEAEADRARDRAAAMAARIQQAEADLRAAEARIAILASLQREQARRLAERQAPIARLIAGLQTLTRRPPVLALLQPGSVKDAVHMRIVLANVMPVIAERTAGLRAEITRSKALRADAETARDALADARALLTRRRSELARAEAEMRLASRDYRETAAVETERAMAIGEDARDIADLMDRMERAGSVRERLIALPGPEPRPQSVAATRLPDPSVAGRTPTQPAYALPVVGDIVTGFGEVSDSGVQSRGLTLATAAGATVVAPADGRVAFAGPFRDFGQIVIIDHGGGWTTLITGMRRASAAVGDGLRQGDPVGVAPANTPRITLELRRGERPVDVAALVR